MAQLKAQRAGIRNEQPLVTGQERPEKAVYADPTGPRGDIYPKGSWVAHTLRQLIGDADFFKSIRTLVYGRPDPRPGNCGPQFGTNQGFRKIGEEVTGEDDKEIGRAKDGWTGTKEHRVGRRMIEKKKRKKKKDKETE